MVVKIGSNEKEIVLYRAFLDNVYNPEFVLYPCCGCDISPAEVFRHVTFVDMDMDSIEKLLDSGRKACLSDIREFRPLERFDLLVLMNSTIPVEWASKHLERGRMIIANDYSGNATNMYSQPNLYELFGTLDFDKAQARFTRDVLGLFTPVTNIEELKEFRINQYNFLLKGITHLLRCNEIEPDENLEERYLQYLRFMGKPEILPFKRVAEKYIFVKK